MAKIIDGYEILAQTKWYRLSTDSLIPCKRCEKPFPSSSLGVRTCPACHKILDGVRFRAATTAKETEYKEDIAKIFDDDIVSRTTWSRRFDEMKRCQAALDALVRAGQGTTMTAYELDQKVQKLHAQLFPKDKEKLYGK